MSEENKTKKVKKILGIKGMNDILPEDAPVWELLENTVESVLKSYGYERIRTPIVEETGLFARGLGAVTDIVEKEMYSFEDSLNGDQLTLRPESTAGVVRAVVEHNLTYNGPKRLWYSGPMFRHERPQRGRYRQFHQIGAEAVGFPGPDIDAELILLCQRLWDDLGLENIRLEINSIGNAGERNRHRADLIAYFEQHKGLLDEDAQRRLYSNPLRILDTKNPTMQDMVNAAPKLLDYLEIHTNVPVVNPYPELKNRRDYQWYFKTDTHWNDAAGFLVSGQIIDAAGGTSTPIEDVTVTYEPRDPGDLANLFHMPESMCDDTKADVSGYRNNVTIHYDSASDDGNIAHISAVQTPDPRRIAIYRDSFGTALLAGLPKYFAYTDFYHWQVFEPEFLNENKPDVLVYEVVERDLGRMMEDLEKLMPNQ